MNYSAAGSIAGMSKVVQAFTNYFKFANTANLQYRQFFDYDTWISNLKTDLDAGRPVIYYGDDGTSGHAWICDGYQGTDMFHMNWGWSGKYNGYFNIDNLNVNGFAPDLNQAAVFGLKPDTAQYPYNCSGLTNVINYGFGTIEDGSGPVADYQNNLNCNWLIGPGDSVQKIILSFIRFNTAPSDEVKVYDGSSLNDPLLGSFSGTDLPTDIISTGPVMLVTFTSDNGTTSDGWMAAYQADYHNPGINEQTIKDLEIYPVPAHDYLNLSFTVLFLQSIQIDIVSAESEIVFSEKTSSFAGRYDKRVNLSSMAQGIYLLRITTDSAVSVAKIIVQ
jgi:hypothetical protein